MRITLLIGCVTAGVGTGTLSAWREAQAFGPIALEVAGKIGGGTSPTPGTRPGNNVNPLGFGSGARAGMSFMNLYVGVSVMYYFGSSERTSCCSSFSENMGLVGIEGGYNFNVHNQVTLRPQLGIGNVVVYSADWSAPVGYSSFVLPSSTNYFYLEPGITGILALGLVLVGAGANLLSLPNVSAFSNVAFTAHAQVGVKL